MADFNHWYDTAMGWEGGYANVAGDRGGETYKGITRKNFPSWPGWPLVDQAKRTNGGTNGGSLPRGYIIQNSTLDALVRQFAKEQFWNFYQADQIQSQPLANMIVDFGWASGLVTSAKVVQGLVNVAQDGKFGANTLNAINRQNPRTLFNRLLKYRLSYIDQIIERDPSQAKFEKGWKDRINDFEKPNRRYWLAKIAAGGLIAATAVYFYVTADV